MISEPLTRETVMHKALVRVALAVLFAAFTTAALAQQFPTRPIRIIVTIPPDKFVKNH